MNNNQLFYIINNNWKIFSALNEILARIIDDNGNKRIESLSQLKKIEREIKPIKIKRVLSEYEQFLWNVVRKNEDRFLSMCSAIGYLMHGYKDKSTAKAIILVDEKISTEPNGRSGKSLFGDAISRMKSSIRIDGKNFEFKPSFTFQEIEQ